MPDMRKLLPAIAGIVVVAGAATFAALNGTDADPTFQGLPGYGSYAPVAGCVESLPPAIDEPQFRPASLSLPDGSVAIRTSPDPAPGLHVIVYRVPLDLDAFVQHVLDRWPNDGWVLGRGERESGEAESVFYSPDKRRYGQFRARSIYCDLDQTEVLLTIGENVRSS